MLDHVKAAAPLKLGYLPTHRYGVFETEVAAREKAHIEKRLQELDIDYVGIDWLNEEGLLYDPTDAEEVAERFRREGVDAVFAAHCDFGQEVAVGRVCKALRKPILLWGPRDEAPGPMGERERDTQCGLFATSKLLRRLNLPFTYVINCTLDAPLFERGMDVFLRAANVFRSVRGARIGQISTRPTPFTSTMCNESELLERFDVEVVPTPLPDLVADVVPRADSEQVTEEVERIEARMDTGAVGEDYVRRLASLKLVMQEWAEDQKLDALAIHCWDAIALPLGIVPCFLNGLLAEIGVPVACETDINGAVTSLALQAAARAETPIFFADLTIRHPENDNSELLWHCGPFPISLAAEGQRPALSGHYMRPGEQPGCGNFRIKGGDITLGRFDGDNGDYRFLMGHVRGCDGPETRGTYVWVEAENWPLWEERLIYGPYIHHIVGIHGKLVPALYEGMKYLGIPTDLVEPDERQVQAYLRGQKEL
ncbi:MAG: L-fucose/L-arabinose isomerase family protein [Candidatus Brocadiia bacterium]